MLGSRERSRMRYFWLVIPQVVLASIASGFLVCCTFDLVALVFPIWLLILFLIVRKYSRAENARDGGMVLITHLVVTALTVAMAVAAPGKTIDLVLARPVKLAKEQMTLAELQEYYDQERWSAFSARFSFNVPAEIESQTVIFPSTEMTLREFLQSLESQTPLRYRMSHCGNGYSILRGGDCCFGVFVHDPANPYSYRQ